MLGNMSVIQLQALENGSTVVMNMYLPRLVLELVDYMLVK